LPKFLATAGGRVRRVTELWRRGGRAARRRAARNLGRQGQVNSDVDGLRLLIVEDDAQVGSTLADTLRAAGHTVCGVARTTTDAIVMTRLHRPSIAIVDLRLGDGDGVEIARQLLRMSGVGILFLTGYPDDLQRRADVGHAWMQKPYAPGDLTRGVELVAAMRRGVRLPEAIPASFHPIVP
jgi:CheY-like chemotaxis protein